MLDAPFSATDLEWRVQRAMKNGMGIVVPYVTARAIMTRFDEAVGKDNWKCEYHDIPNGGVACVISVKVEGEWVGKEDAAQCTQVEPIKGGRSAALKRAAVVWGVGRYLYKLGEVKATLANGKYFNDKVILPDAFLPESEHTGNDEIKVVKKEFTHPAKVSASVEELEKAKSMVVEGEKFNNGKTLGELWDKALQGIAKWSKNSELKQAAQLILDNK